MTIHAPNAWLMTVRRKLIPFEFDWCLSTLLYMYYHFSFNFDYFHSNHKPLDRISSYNIITYEQHVIHICQIMKIPTHILATRHNTKQYLITQTCRKLQHILQTLDWIEMGKLDLYLFLKKHDCQCCTGYAILHFVLIWCAKRQAKLLTISWLNVYVALYILMFHH